MAEPQRYAIDPESLQGCRLRVSFHFKELQHEKDPQEIINEEKCQRVGAGLGFGLRMMCW